MIALWPFLVKNYLMPKVHNAETTASLKYDANYSLWRQTRNYLGSLSLSERVSRPLALAAIIGATAFGGVEAEPVNAELLATRRAEPMTYVGFNTNKVFVNDFVAADAEAAAVAATGANTIRIQVPYTQGGAEVKNDVLRLCNAARATYNHGLHLEITMVGYDKDASLGYMPSTISENRKMETAISHMMWSLAGDTNKDGSGGCVPEQKNLRIGFFNEANNETFDPNQTVNGKWVAPRQLASLMRYLYPRLHKEALKPGLNVYLTLVGGDLATTARNRPVQFIKELATYMNSDKESQLPMDAFAVHSYANGYDGTSVFDGSQKSVRLGKVIYEIRKNFGADMPIYLNEVGAISATPSSKENKYEVRLPASVFGFNGQGQADFYQQSLRESACAGIEEMSIFYLKDDPYDQLRTGIKYPDGSNKPGAEKVIKSYKEALAGDSIDCP